MRAGIAVSALAVALVAGCAGSDQTAVPGANSKTAICARALAVTAAIQLGNDLKRKAEQAKDAATVLRELAAQTQDHTLAVALSAAADKAGEAARREFSSGDLSRWAAETADQIAALRQACL